MAQRGLGAGEHADVGVVAPETTLTDSGLFARKATGLVRNITARQQLAWNFVAGGTVLGLTIGVFFALSGFPGGSLLLAMLLALPLSLGFAYAFGLMTAAMPRSGGDYMIVSRTLGPRWGLVSSSCMQLGGGYLSMGSLALVAVTLCIAPGLSAIAVVGGTSTLGDWASTLASSKGWQYGIGGALILGGGAAVAFGWRVTRRVVFWFLGASLAGLALSVVVELFTSQSSFISNFNSTAAAVTGQGNTYQATIDTAREAGIVTDPGFSMNQTWPLIGVVAAFAFFSYNTTFLGGELREGNSLKTAHLMALSAILGMATIALSVLVFYKTFGSEFLTAAYGGGFPAELGTVPGYPLLTSLQLDSTLVAVFLSLSLVLGVVAILPYGITLLSRQLFAWGFDGVLPRPITTVSSGRNAPVVAAVVATALSLLAYAWCVFVADNLAQVLAYLGLIQFAAQGFLVGLAAMVFPYRHPELYRASVSSKAQIAGIPLVSIAGAMAFLGAAVIWYIYFKFDYFGLTNVGPFFLWLGATVAFGLVVYAIASAVRARQGVNLRLVYAEIPPE